MLKKQNFRFRYRPQVRSRHPTHAPLRAQLNLLPFRSIIRLGSTTELKDNVKRIELNSVEAIKNSSSKLRMKKAFTDNEVKTAVWWTTIDGDFFYIYEPDASAEGMNTINELEYPMVAKHIFGSRGRGNTLLKSKEELENWLQGKTLNNYIFEKFYNYNREYRLHVTKDGCFYTNRKMLRADAPEDKRWFRNDSNSNWIKEDNEMFDKPVNWDKVIEESVKALNAVGLDFGAVDLRIQSTKDSKGRLREDPDFIVVEINSAPSFGDITLEKYLEVLPKLLKDKFELLK